MMSNFKMGFMRMAPDKRFSIARKTDVETGERFYELGPDLYSLAFFAFYIDDEERAEMDLFEKLEL